jgi:hypothetical protein
MDGYGADRPMKGFSEAVCRYSRQGAPVKSEARQCDAPLNSL